MTVSANNLQSIKNLLSEFNVNLDDDLRYAGTEGEFDDFCKTVGEIVENINPRFASAILGNMKDQTLQTENKFEKSNILLNIIWTMGCN